MNKTNQHRHCLSRRNFLATTIGAALAAPLFIPARALGRDGAVPPSERITLGSIGAGPRGQLVLGCMLAEKDVQCLAVCDVQRNRREAMKQKVDAHYGNNNCATYRDMFEMIARKDIDAVLVATGDRWHALAAAICAQAGKDVYCEKPCGTSIGQAQELAQVIGRTGRVFQCGTQRRSQGNFQYAVYLAQSGRLGRLHTLHASVYRPSASNHWLPAEPEPDPEDCDWDRWLGPSLWRPYHRSYVNGNWRGYFDLEAGANLLDWGAHTVDLCQWANRADDTMPLEYEATANHVVARYANGVKLVCDFLPNAFSDRAPQYRNSTGICPVRFEGDEGWVETGDNGEVALSENLVKSQRKQFAAPGQTPTGHIRNFSDCVKSRALPTCHATIMRRSHIACYAAALAWELGRKLTLDPVKEEFIGDPEANRLRHRAMRAPWRF